MGRSGSKRAASLLSAMAYDAEREFFLLEIGRENAAGFGFVCEPLSGVDDRSFERLKVLLNDNYPSGTFMQFFLWSSQNVEETMLQVSERSIANPNDFVREAAAQRTTFLRAGIDQALDPQSGLKVRDFKLLVSLKIPVDGIELSPAELEAIETLKISVRSSLQSAGLRPSLLDADGYLTVMSELMNRAPHSSWRLDGHCRAVPDYLLRDQVFDFSTKLEIRRGELVVGESVVSMLSPKRFPQRMQFGAASFYIGDLMSGARGIRGPFAISATVQFLDQTNARNIQGRRHGYVTNASMGSVARFQPGILTQKRDSDILQESLGQQGAKICKFYLTMILFSKDARDAAESVTKAQSYWAEQGWVMLRDQYYLKPFFLNALPLNTEPNAVTEMQRFRTLTTEHVALMLPVISDWKGTGTPSLNFVTRNGQLVNMDLFDSPSNYNLVISAQSGSGKSFLTNEIILSYLAEGAKVWVIDIGRSYKKLCDVVGGEFIAFNRDSGIGASPFRDLRDFNEEGDAALGIIIAMAARTEKLKDLQVAELKRIVSEQWAIHGRDLSIDILADTLCAEPDPRIVDLGRQLFAFTSKGDLGIFFSGSTSRDFNANFTVLEMEELGDNAHLKQVVLLQFIHRIQQAMYRGDRTVKKILVIDECWSLLADGHVGPFLEGAFRKFRKYNASAITISQSAADFYGTEAGQAIVDNSAHSFYLSQKSETIENLVRDGKLSLSPGAVMLLKTVHTLPGRYSEIFLHTPRGSGIARLLIPPFLQLVFSTKPDDVNAINRWLAKGLTTPEAINAVLKDRELGQSFKLGGKGQVERRRFRDRRVA